MGSIEYSGAPRHGFIAYSIIYRPSLFEPIIAQNTRAVAVCSVLVKDKSEKRILRQKI